MPDSRDCLPALSVVDSPIEGRLVATMFGRWEFQNYIELCRKTSNARIAVLFDARGELICVLLQAELVELPGRRIDMLVEHYSGSLIVEIDGAKFHSSPEAMARDRQKDRNALVAGFQTVRFTGKEVWDSPEKCVEQIRQIAIKIGNEAWTRERAALDAQYAAMGY